MTKEKMKSLSKWLAIGVLSVLCVFSVAKAFSGSAQNVAESGATLNVYNQGSEVAGESLGASANRVPHGYLDTSDGYFVDGVSVIDGSGNVNGFAKTSVASSTPFGQLAIGAGGNTTSTISAGKFCMYAGQENGVAVYVRLGSNQANNQPFATSTVSCF